MAIDAAICLALLLFALAGWRRGLVLEVGSIVGFFAGLAVAAAFWRPLALFLHSYVPGQMVAAVLAFVLLFALTYALVAVAAGLVRGFVHLLFLGWVDRLAGLVLGLAKGLVVVELALLLIARLPSLPVGFGSAAGGTVVPRSWLAGSRLAPALDAQQAQLLGPLFAPFSARIPLLATLLAGGASAARTTGR